MLLQEITRSNTKQLKLFIYYIYSIIFPIAPRLNMFYYITTCLFANVYYYNCNKLMNNMSYLEPLIVTLKAEECPTSLFFLPLEVNKIKTKQKHGLLCYWEIVTVLKTFLWLKTNCYKTLCLSLLNDITVFHSLEHWYKPIAHVTAGITARAVTQK